VNELVSVLNRERQVLETLLFRLLEARGLLATGEARFLGWAAEDLEQASESVREVELRRATVVAEMIEGDDSPTLRDLVDATDEPYASLLDDHRIALGRLAVEVGAATEATQELADEGLRRLRNRQAATPGTDLDIRVPGEEKATTRREAHLPVQRRSNRTEASMDELDREILAAGFEAVLSASERLVLPSLVAFLG
jgi:hypothetical protein